MLEELLKEIKELNIKVDTYIKNTAKPNVSEQESNKIKPLEQESNKIKPLEQKINDILFDNSETDTQEVNIDLPVNKNKKFNLVIEKIKPEEKKNDEKSSDSNSYSIDEDGIDFFPVRYRTINVNLNEDHIIITRPTKIIRINF